jgi:hypothetical protein
MWMLTCRMVDLLSTLHKETTLTSDPTGIFKLSRLIFLMRIDAFDNLYYCGETMSCFLSEKYPSHFNVINTAKLHFYVQHCIIMDSKLDLRPSNLQLMPCNFQIQYSYLLNRSSASNS